MNPLLVLLGEVTVVFGAALLGTILASKARAALRHLILASAFGVVLILPAATLVSPTVAMEFDALPMRELQPVAVTSFAPPVVEATEIAPTPLEAPTIEAFTPPPTPAQRLPLTTWLLLGWATVAFVALIPVATGLRHFGRIRRSGHLWPEGAERAAQLMHPSGMPRLSILLSARIAAPITGGLIRPAVAMPVGAMTWHDSHLENALVHELEHVRRHDWAVHLAARVVCALYWFHPLSWIAWRTLRLEAERACDDAVLAHEDGAVYAEQLLALARQLAGKPALPGLNMSGGSSLSSRIKSALDHKRKRGRVGVAAFIGLSVIALLAIILLAPLRPVGPTRNTVTPASTGPATSAAASADPSPASTPEASAFNFRSGIGLADLREGGCLSIFNSSVQPGTRITLVTAPSSDPPSVIDATVEAIQVQECRSSLDRNEGANLTPTYYKLAVPAKEKLYGVAFAVLDSPGTIALRNGQITADIDGDGSPESFEACASVENMHYSVWSGIAAQRQERWHGNIYARYDMEPTCPEVAIAAVRAVRATEPEQPGTFSGNSGSNTASPREVVSGILELIQSALADEVTGKLDDIERPITGLHHVQRHAQAVLNDDGSNPGSLAAHYVEIVNALVTTANGAATIAGRRPELRLSPEKFQQLAAAMRVKSAELASVVMPVSDIQPNVMTPEQEAALNALALARTARRETRFSPSWLPTHLNTLERAALSVASDDGTTPGATTMKVSLLRSALGVATRQANEISGRPAVVADVRRKAAELAVSLNGVVDQLDGGNVGAKPTTGIE